jgi:hypothetical protein
MRGKPLNARQQHRHLVTEGQQKNGNYAIKRIATLWCRGRGRLVQTGNDVLIRWRGCGPPGHEAQLSSTAVWQTEGHLYVAHAGRPTLLLLEVCVNSAWGRCSSTVTRASRAAGAGSVWWWAEKQLWLPLPGRQGKLLEPPHIEAGLNGHAGQPTFRVAEGHAPAVSPNVGRRNGAACLIVRLFQFPVMPSSSAVRSIATEHGSGRCNDSRRSLRWPFRICHTDICRPFWAFSPRRHEGPRRARPALALSFFLLSRMAGDSTTPFRSL